MLNQLLPRQVDNTYHGYKLALWLFAVLVFMKVVISLRSIFDPYAVASEADGIPLDTFTTAASRTVISLFAILGLSNLVICLLCILVLARYRALISFMFALLLLQQLGGALIRQMMPIVRIGTPPGVYVTLILLALTVVGLALSLWNRVGRQPMSRTEG